ncbi:MAG: hypothetical protein KAI40_01980 [Desulfobacterales bacterium]|nr:hypothetical protein [Desulfobacterales bacterium]
MEIIIDTSQHCIKTGSKKEYERLIRQYFKAGLCEKEKSIMEQQIEALIYFLENVDFSDLRNQYHKIGPSGKSSVLVFPQTLKEMYIRFDQRILSPIWKKR